ncbi:MAG: FAD-dependent oxidoreductase [Acidobacteriota bacterium]
MGKIIRDIGKAEKENFELIITGGGIYGIMLLLEASRRNIKTLLLEKGDFGGATTLNHLKTVHGGLRYLQSLDLPRFRESVSERKWFIKNFPQYVNPMSCLMPLYGNGLKRNSIMRGALMLNDLFSFTRNSGIQDSKKLPGGKILSAERTAEQFKGVDKKGLKGSALWYDANIEEFQRLIMTILRKSVDMGSVPLNYVEVKELKTENNEVKGVKCIDVENGKEVTFSGEVVINAGGPWSRDISADFDKDFPELFKKNLMLWNILFDREALSGSALGLTPNRGRGHTYFLHPWKGRLLVGTGEIVVGNIKDNVKVPEKEVDKFISEMNSAIPGINLTRQNILKIYAGILPATDSGKLSKRPALIDHSATDGPKGLFSLSGVKFTTSRLVAEKAIKKIFPVNTPKNYNEIFGETENIPDLTFGYDQDVEKKDIELLKKIVEEESVIHLSDLVFRRTSLGENPPRALKTIEKLKPLFPGNEKWWKKEKSDTEKLLKSETGE